MKNIKSLLAFLLVFPWALSAQVDRSKAPQPGPAPEIKIGEYQSFQLKNGLKVFLVENHKIPRVAYSLLLDIDPLIEGENAGYSVLAGELLGTATTSRTKDQIDEEIDFIGATITTGPVSLSGASLKKHNKVLLELMSDILLNPVFTEDELEKVRKQTLSILAFNKNDPAAISDDVSDILFYGKDHPYGEIMTEASVNSVTVGLCEKYYRTWFRPNIAYLAIVGDMDLKEAKKLVRKTFGSWEPGEVPSSEYELPSPPEQLTFSIVDRPHAVQSVIKVGYPVDLTVGDEDYIKARVMNVLLGGGAYRLYENLREEHGYTYGAYSQLNQDKYVGNFEATTDVRNEVTDSAVYQILYELRRLREEPVSEEELNIVKNYMTGNFSLSLENPSTVARFALNTVRYGLPEDYYANYLRSIAMVGPEDIREMALKYLKPDNAHVVIVGKADVISEGLARLSPSGMVDYYDNEGNYIDPASRVKPLPEGLTAGDIIDRYLEATGGRDVYAAITDHEIKMKMVMQGMEVIVETYRKAPDLLNVTMILGGSILSKTLFDGEKGSVSGMQGNQVLEGEELESLKAQAMFMPELDYQGNGFQTRLVSIETVEGEETYKLEITDPSGGVTEEFYSIGSGLRIRADVSQGTPGGSMVQTTLFKDYREVKGILYPHRMDISFGPQSFTSTVESLRFNTGMDDGIFK